MSIYIIHDGNKILNRVVADNPINVGSGLSCIEAIGMWDGYIGQGVNADGVIPDPIVEPVVIIPQEVSMRQARLALLTIGKLAAIETAITAMAGIDGEAARIEWEYAQTIKRDHALLLSLQADVLAMTDAELDQLFIDASNL